MSIEDDDDLDVFGDDGDLGDSGRAREDDDAGAVLDALTDDAAGGGADDESVRGADPEPAAPAADRARQAAEAEQVVAAWDAEVAKQQAGVEAAKANLEKLEREFEDGANNAAARVEAQDKLLEAKLAAREAAGQRARAQDWAKQAAAPSNPAMDAWIARNPRFQADKQFADEAVATARAIAAERGLRDDHPEFYRELDKRLKRTPAMKSKGSGVAPPSRAGAGRESASVPGVPDGALGVLKKFGGRMGLLRPGMSKDEQLKVAREFGKHYQAMQTERGGRAG